MPTAVSQIRLKFSNSYIYISICLSIYVFKQMLTFNKLLEIYTHQHNQSILKNIDRIKKTIFKSKIC